MKDRIREIRKASPYGKTQDTFAEFLGIPKSNLASYEIGRRNPSDAVIQLICKKCGVSEEWLESGTGPMFKEIPNKLAFYLGQIEGGNDDFIKDLVEVYMELDQNSKDALKKIATSMAKKISEREQT